MMDRRQLLRNLSAIPLLAAAQPKDLHRFKDPKFGFLGFGPATEEKRVGVALEKLSSFGARYGFEVVPLNARQLEKDSFRDLAGTIVYGAEVRGLVEPEAAGGSSEDRPGFSTARLGDKAIRYLSKTIKRGAGLVAIHGAAGISPSNGVLARNQARRSSWVSLLGGESIGALAPQTGRVRMADRSVPGMGPLDSGFEVKERWLALKNFDPRMHVVMVQETAGLEGALYQRPSFPLTWFKYHGRGRVFYTGLGYELQGWDSDVVRRTMVGGALWVLRDTEADVSANFMRVTPKAIQAVYPLA